MRQSQNQSNQNNQTQQLVQQQQQAQSPNKEDRYIKARKIASTVLSVAMVAAVIIALALSLPAGLPAMLGSVFLGGATYFVLEPTAKKITNKVFGIKIQKSKERTSSQAQNNTQSQSIGKSQPRVKSRKERALAAVVKTLLMIGVVALAVTGAAGFLGIVGVIAAASLSFSYKGFFQREINRYGNRFASRVVNGPSTEEQREKRTPSNPIRLKRVMSGLITAGVITGIAAAAVLTLPIGLPTIFGSILIGTAISFVAKPAMKLVSDKIVGIKPEERQFLDKRRAVELEPEKENEIMNIVDNRSKKEKIVTNVIEATIGIGLLTLIGFAALSTFGIVGVLGAAVLAHAYQKQIGGAISKISSKLGSKIAGQKPAEVVVQSAQQQNTQQQLVQQQSPEQNKSGQVNQNNQQMPQNIQQQNAQEQKLMKKRSFRARQGTINIQQKKNEIQRKNTEIGSGEAPTKESLLQENYSAKVAQPNVNKVQKIVNAIEHKTKENPQNKIQGIISSHGQDSAQPGRVKEKINAIEEKIKQQNKQNDVVQNIISGDSSKLNDKNSQLVK